MPRLWSLTATEMAARIRSGDVTSVALVEACLHRIELREDVVRAWEWLDPALALEQAYRCDREAPRGALHGVPVGVKDIFDTADMPTACGSPIHEGRRPQADAECVHRVRAAGAVILGKTVTTEFATFKPGKTRNPHDPERTPGGSSSGSAAAVADGMVPLAFGSQTVGSVVRPASFCGVVGYKADYGRFDLSGMKPLASRLDSLGFFARSVRDIALFADTVAGKADAGMLAVPNRPPRVALMRTAQWNRADPASQQAVEATALLLVEGGADLDEPGLPAEFADLPEVQNLLFTAGAAEALATEWRDHRNLLSPQLCSVLEVGLSHGPAEVAAAEATAERCRAVMDELFEIYDVVLAPAAPGEAPTGLDKTGDPLFSRMWTLLHGPCLSLPGHSGKNGMPVGVQLIGRRGSDDRLLAWADWLAERMPASADFAL
jgi:Asp-tRNA(Asn)/Glu-tRNA(Gln) amidotransferase A subunit family amidase